MAQKYPKIAQNGPKMTQNCPNGDISPVSPTFCISAGKHPMGQVSSIITIAKYHPSYKKKHSRKRLSVFLLYFFLAIPTCWSKTRAMARGTQRRGRNILKGKESDWQQLGNWSQLKKAWKAKNCHAQKWTNTCLPRNIFFQPLKSRYLELSSWMRTEVCRVRVALYREQQVWYGESSSPRPDRRDLYLPCTCRASTEGTTIQLTIA